MSVDADGLTSRWDVADQIRDRYRLRTPSIDLVEEMREGLLAHSGSTRWSRARCGSPTTPAGCRWW